MVWIKAKKNQYFQSWMLNKIKFRSKATVLWMLLYFGSYTSFEFTHKESETQMSKTRTVSIKGIWLKISKNECDKSYPAKIRFGENGIYQALEKPESVFYTWDVGTYEMKDNAKIFVSCANDKIESYKIKFSRDESECTITLGKQCHLVYKRIS